MPLVYTPLATDLFQRPNENPIDPAHWTTDSALGLVALSVASHLCSSQDSIDQQTTSGSYYSAINFPDNQYAEFTVGSLTANNGSIFIGTRFNPNTFSGYFCQVTHDSIDHVDSIALFGGNLSLLLDTNLNTGDVVRLGCFGTAIAVAVNQTIVLSGVDSLVTSGTVFLSVNPVVTVADTNISRFAAGSITQSTVYSVPDDRVYGNFPNNSRTVQSTITYDVPSVFSLRYWFDTLFNRTQPLPIDSRVITPTDSRTAPNIPQNSRTS
jgi:hypothetical protein